MTDAPACPATGLSLSVYPDGAHMHTCNVTHDDLASQDEDHYCPECDYWWWHRQ